MCRNFNCRFCKANDNFLILDLGKLAYTGQFPNQHHLDVDEAEISLVRCSQCGLIQLDQTYPAEEMYGSNYGYRSSITNTMINHLNEIALFSRDALGRVEANSSKINILDIGANDGTLLEIQRKFKSFFW